MRQVYIYEGVGDFLIWKDITGLFSSGMRIIERGWKKGPNMDNTLGQILIGKNIITQTQLELALRRQKQQKGKYLGQILTEMGSGIPGKNQ